MTDNSKVRLDKWLWAARFYKTRGLAIEAIKGGHVQLNGQRAKPAKTVALNDEVSIKKSSTSFEVRVTGLSEKRGSATMAAELYQETEHSLRQREEQAEQRKLFHANQPPSARRPDKKQRRNIIRFKNIHDA